MYVWACVWLVAGSSACRRGTASCMAERMTGLGRGAAVAAVAVGSAVACLRGSGHTRVGRVKDRMGRSSRGLGRYRRAGCSGGTLRQAEAAPPVPWSGCVQPPKRAAWVGVVSITALAFGGLTVCYGVYVFVRGVGQCGLLHLATCTGKQHDSAPGSDFCLAGFLGADAHGLGGQQCNDGLSCRGCVYVRWAGRDRNKGLAVTTRWHRVGGGGASFPAAGLSLASARYRPETGYGDCKGVMRRSINDASAAHTGSCEIVNVLSIDNARCGGRVGEDSCGVSCR